jgi:hypothetical protein
MPHYLDRFCPPDSYYDPPDEPVIYEDLTCPDCEATSEDCAVYLSRGSSRRAIRYEASCDACGYEWEWETHPDE